MEERVTINDLVAQLMGPATSDRRSEHAGTNLLAISGLSASWALCPGIPLNPGVVSALEFLETASRDASGSWRLNGAALPKGAITALVTLTTRGDELTDTHLNMLMDILGRFRLMIESPHDFLRTTGILRAVLTLSTKNPRCFKATIRLIDWLIEGKAEAVFEEGRQNGIDYKGIVVRYVSQPSLFHGDNNPEENADLMGQVLALGCSILRNSRPPAQFIENVRMMLNAVKQGIEQTSANPDIVRAYRVWLVDLAIRGNWNIPATEVERLWFESGVFYQICRADLLALNNFSLLATELIDGMFPISPAFQLAFLQSDFLGGVENLLSQDASTIWSVYAILRMLVQRFDEQHLDLLMNNSRFREHLMLPQRFNSLELVNCILKRYSARSLQSKSIFWPIVQLNLAKIFLLLPVSRNTLMPILQERARTLFNLLHHMQSTPLAVTLREMKDLRIPRLAPVLTNPASYKRILLIWRWQHSGFTKERLDLAWLFFVAGLPFARDERGKVQDPFAGKYPADNFGHRIMGLYAIVWATGIASFSRFRDSNLRINVWLPIDVWQLVWKMLYE